MVMPMGKMAPDSQPSSPQDVFGSSPEAPPVGAPNVSAESPDFIGGAGGAFMPIPEQVVAADSASVADGIDLGDDLLQDPTRILVKPPTEATSNLVRELEGDLAGAKSVDAELLLRKSERYIAKRNYYMARKILRHALAVGGDETRIKERLRDIRKLELPESLYSAISSDEGAKEGSEEILSRLEEEFDLNQEENEAAAEMAQNIDFQMENIFRETDPRTILDFGVALHEMGLFRQAETVFARLVDEFPETSFDAYYLAAISKFARKDYAGAASILKTLSADGGKTELEKIQVYYVLGELFEKMQRPDSSKEFYRKVAEIDANYRNIRHKLED
jgi:tetratricopeptide (TPR) repeat protein